MNPAFSISGLNAEWQREAPYCSCGKDKVLYICLEEKCRNRHQIIYCTLCTERNYHSHVHLQIKDSMKEVLRSWNLFSEIAEGLDNKATESFKFWEPLILYLESISVPQKHVRKVSADIQSLKFYMTTLRLATDNIEQLIQERRIHEMLQKWG